jgi:hypothetical protein
MELGVERYVLSLEPGVRLQHLARYIPTERIAWKRFPLYLCVCAFISVAIRRNIIFVVDDLCRQQDSYHKLL